MDARELLRTELTERCRRNPRYSLRAFAKALGLSPTVLSLVMSGKRPLSRKAAVQVSDALGLGPEAREALERSRLPGMPAREAPVSIPKYGQISIDTYSLIAHWHHYAVLSLLELPSSRFEAKWISRRLGISEIQARLSMDLLKRLNLVEKVGKGRKGRWKQSDLPIKVENTVSTAATRRFHKELLEKAVESLENDPMPARDFSSITLAMDPALVPYAKERIRAFRRELCAELERKGEPSVVYNLAVQIFPVSKNVSKKKE